MIAIGIPLMLMFSPVMIRIDPELLITTGIIVILFVTAALGCAIVMERGRAGRWMQSGVIASIIGGAGWTALFLLNDHITEWLWLVLLTWPTCWAGLMLVVGILLLPANREGWWRWLRRVTIMLTALLAAHICLATSLHP